MTASTTVTNTNKDTVSIPPAEAGKQAVTTCDTRFATFIALEYGRLDGLLQARAEEVAGQSLEWINGEPDKKSQFRPLGAKQDKRTYRAFAYTDSRQRPRRRLTIWNRRAWAVETTFDDLAVLNDEYRTWEADVLSTAGRLTPAERQRIEAERAARRAQDEERRLECRAISAIRVFDFFAFKTKK